GTPCPTAGTTCDDGDASTQNDVEDGNCNCEGTPCPTAGTTCDDGDASTQNDVEDGNCNCEGTPASSLQIEYGTITNVSDTWQTITLNNNYNSMVVIASVVLPSNTAHPAVSRIRNATGNSFEVRIQQPGVLGSDLFDLHYIVAEEGVYTEAQDGIKMEVVKANSSVTANNVNWVREQRLYNNSYSNPVVVGQVMSYNDSNWSVFWASIDNARSVAPGPGAAFACGKEVGEDQNAVRADETIGYLILEAGAGNINGLTYSAGVGSDIIRGVGNTSVGYNYNVAGLSSIDAAVVSVAGMDGGNGGWPTLFGTTSFNENQLTLAFDEDQVLDSERRHTTEQTAYLAFGTSNVSRAISTHGVVKHNSQLQVFPNPAMDHATIQYIVTADGFTQIELYDLMGRKVQTLVQATQSTGKHTLTFENNTNLEGVYLLVFTLNEEQVIKKLVFKRP
ncbi:MAG: T9SS type A sorting domain-containing protein, partial [Saprospiraceae bacterium]